MVGESLPISCKAACPSFAVDIHLAVPIGNGVFIDHATPTSAAIDDGNLGSA
jgi:serine acetyltransferase